MKTNVARDLFLLSAVAFSNRRYDEAAKLYSAALSSDDSKEFLQSVTELQIDPEQEAPKASMSHIAQAMASVMSEDKFVVSLSDAAEDAEEDTLLHQGNRDQDGGEDDEVEEDDEDDEIYSDEIDPQTPGQRMVLPSLSMVVDSAIAVKSTSGNSKWDVQVRPASSKK